MTEKVKCDCCGNEVRERDLTYCIYCDATKCFHCDAGDDVPCANCEDDE